MDEQSNLYSRRVRKELAITESEISARACWTLPLLSDNPKTSVALDFPLLNCQPTSACASVCYAAQGRQFYRKSVIKALAVSRLIAADPARAAAKMVNEAEGRSIRLAGSGEVLPEHKTLVDCVEACGGAYWGFTRRVDTHRVIPSLMFSFDATTSTNTLQYVLDDVPVHRRAYLRRPSDRAPQADVAVTFPVHGSQTNYVADVPVHETDCAAIRQGEKCWTCRRCY